MSCVWGALCFKGSLFHCTKFMGAVCVYTTPSVWNGWLRITKCLSTWKRTVFSTVSLYNTIITSYQLLSLTNLTDVFPTSAQPDKWLSLQQTLPLSKLVYLDVGPFHQFLRLEFSIPESCFTFLLRDKSKCRECLTRLSSKIHRGIFGARVLVHWCMTMRKPLGERESILLMKQQTRYMYNRMCLPGVQFWSTTDPSLIFCVNVKIRCY